VEAGRVELPSTPTARRGYVELQVNPNNATFDSWFATTRAQAGDPKWDSGMQTQVKLRGSSAPGDTDQGWDAELAIPWQAVRGRDEAMAVRLPPQVGDRWRLNLVRVDVKTGDKNPQASSWKRISSADFHALDRMLTVVFADQWLDHAGQSSDGWHGQRALGQRRVGQRRDGQWRDGQWRDDNGAMGGPPRIALPLPVALRRWAVRRWAALRGKASGRR
jgi:hypothetical protein